MRKRTVEPKSNFQSIEQAAKAFDQFRPARDVLTVVRAVPTCMVQFDHATRVKGLPIERFGLIHGPSAEGKTKFALSLIRSFLALNHFALLIDAERTTPITFARIMMGPLADHPYFFAMRPKTYEDTVEAVRKFVIMVKHQRDAGNVPPNTSAIVITDSIRKLVPEGLLKKLFGEVYEGANSRRRKQLERGKGIDGVGGRAAQIKAAMNAQWLDELTPLLEETGTAFLPIARETEDPDADVMSKMLGRNYKVGGGRALYYDASLVVRVERASYVQDAGDDDGRNRKVFGERHALTIRKTKVSAQDDKQTLCYFHTSNGVLVPEGFDRARDVLELGVKFNVVEQNGSWFNFREQRIAQGAHGAVRALTDNDALLEEIEATVRSKFDDVAPTEVEAA